jgi:hypothetical protein
VTLPADDRGGTLDEAAPPVVQAGPAIVSNTHDVDHGRQP